MTAHADAPPGLVLTEEAARLWAHLAATDEAQEVGQLVATLKLDQSQIMVALGEAEAEGFATIEAQGRDELDLAADLAARLAQGLPELRAAELLAEAGGQLPLPVFVGHCQDQKLAVNEIFKYGALRKSISRERGPGGMIVTLHPEACLPEGLVDVQALRAALDGQIRYLDEVAQLGLDPQRVLDLLRGRTELVKLRHRNHRLARLTDKGRAAYAAGVTVKTLRNSLTQQDLRDDSWRQITLRPYDITLPAATLQAVKAHPVRRVIEQIRQAFLELGFDEVASPAVESAFWNFDALFQPQDHPARDMQDTFYMSQPAQAPLPDEAVVRAVQAAHENGGETGSAGWGYQWRPERAQQVVLRTHATAATIRALAANPKPPYKAFCVGWTHRNETLSYKHLPVFHQVDGIIIDEHASLATLLGTLTAFYQKMGFEKVRFKPAFYPYTEPSVDVMVYMPERGKWLEMGGSGIFRPEVTEPLGCKHPVLAWGLGVERLAMLRLGFSDIRDLYKGGLETIEEVPLCR